MRLIRSLSSQHLFILGSLGRVALSMSELQTCYFPDGSLAQNNFPCFLDQKDSPCCGSGTICEASGLCKIQGSTGVSNLIRGSCTDSTWDSPECPQYCLLPKAMAGGTNIISCENVTSRNLDFCCDHMDGCCNSGIGRFQVLFNTDIVTLGSLGATVSTFAPTSTSSTSTSSTLSSVTTTSSSSSASLIKTSSDITSSGITSTTASSTSAASTANIATINTPSSASLAASTNSEQSKGLSTGALVGIAIACTIVGIAAIGGLVFYLLYKRKSPAPGVIVPQSEKPDQMVTSQFVAQPIQAQPYEIMTNTVRRGAELQA